MIRSGQAASLTRSSIRYVTASNALNTARLARQYGLTLNISRARQAKKPVTLALTIHKPLSTSLQRYATHPGSPFDPIDSKHEKELGKEHMEPHPEEVSATSSVHEVFHEKGVDEGEKDEDMLAGVKEDLVGSQRRHNVTY